MSIDVRRIKQVGIKHEYELLGELKKANYVACRLPGSSIRNPDLIAGDGDSVFVIETKITTRNKLKIQKQQIKTLIKFAWKFRAEAWVAVKFLNQTKWLFIKPNALEISEDNETLSIDYNTAQLKGISIEEVVSNELQKKII